MTKSLAISSHFTQSQLLGGVASFVHNLLRGIEVVVAKDSRFQDVQVTVFHGPAGAPYTSDRFEYRPMHSRFGRFGADIRFGLGESSRYDAALFPDYFRPPIVRSRRTVAVIHDLHHMHVPDLITKRKWRWLHWAKGYAVRHCDAIVTITKDVKDDVLRTYGSQWDAKIWPIHHPLAFERLEGGNASTTPSGRPYLLGVGIDRPYKNLYTLIRSFNELRGQFPDLCLVLAGDLRSRRPTQTPNASAINAEMPATVDLVRDLQLEDHVKITGFVSDSELGALYRGATAFVLPSLFEGMGAPAVEAMAMGAPTIVSDLPVFREVTANKAYYLRNPKDVNEMSAAIADVIRAGPSARPSAEAVAEVRGLFNQVRSATKYLECVFDLPPA